MERRVLVAIALSFLVLLVWFKLFPPPKPEEAREPAAIQEVQEPAEIQVTETTAPETPAPRADAPEIPAEPMPIVEGLPGQETILSNERVAFSIDSRGAAIRHIRLEHHQTNKGQPVDLLPHLPLHLEFQDHEDLTKLIEEAPFQMVQSKGRVEYTFGNGTVWIHRTYALEGDFLSFEVEVKGVPEDSWALTLGPVLRELDESEAKSKFIQVAQFVAFESEKPERTASKKLKEKLTIQQPRGAYYGLDGRYFSAIIFPESELASIQAVAVEDEVKVTFLPKGNTFTGNLFAGGKRYDQLLSMGSRLAALIDFGMFSFIAKPMLWMLNWLHSHGTNYGLAIIILTLIIRIILFPLTHKQLKSMKAMQKLQPKIERLKTKYKKHKTDPDERAKMNQEMMELYREEGVNPLGGCLPLLVQLPILWAFYMLLSTAIELRHAPFFLWIVDLSAPDPFYVTPILMGAAMLIQQIMTPTAGSASQRKMFLIMPIVFTFVFLGFPSGLVLYWLTNNVFQIMQTVVYQHLEKKEA